MKKYRKGRYFRLVLILLIGLCLLLCKSIQSLRPLVLTFTVTASLPPTLCKR